LCSGREAEVESLLEDENKLVKEMLASHLGDELLPGHEGLIK
jgi:hypothetical protein